MRTPRINILYALLPLAFGLACGGSSQPPAPPGSSGAFGIVTVNGKQKMYLPVSTLNSAGHGVVAVVDVGLKGNGVAGAPALMADIDLGSADIATTTGGDAKIVIAASTQNKKIWFIDPTSDTLIGSTQLDATAGRSSFSGGGGYVTGIAVDSANRRAILSVWNGFALVDLNSKTITQTILAAPSENFGFDGTRELIIAPFYDCPRNSGLPNPPPCDTYLAGDGTRISEGLNIIDLKDGTVYTYLNAAAADPHAPVGEEPDSAAADPVAGIAVIPSEGNGNQNVIDLTKANFNKANKTVTAPQTLVQNSSFTGVAIDSSQHLGFWEAEFSSRVGLMSVTDARDSKGTFLPAQMPSAPGASGWSNIGDPHGIAVSTGIADGHPVGFLVNAGFKWIARIDLSVMATLPHAQGTMTSAELAPAVTFLDGRTKP